MGRFVRMLALAAVLAHMTLGCCVHHLHAHAAAGGGGPACARDGCGHDHARGDHDGDRPQKRGPAHKGCDHERCSFVRPDVGGEPRPAGERQLLARAASLPETTAAASRSTLDGIDPSRVGCLEPLRLHLKNQILLI